MEVILHIDKYLNIIIQNYGLGVYIILFLIIFCETGLVFTPFLPGDSLLFAIGALSAQGSINIYFILILLMIAAILGDTVNYHVGKYIGPRAFTENSRFLKKEYMDKTNQFYEKYGAKTIVLARFVPIVRTFAPFIAGIGKMSYWKFLWYNALGGIAWVSLFILGGYFFGNMPLVKENFTLVILAIIVISFIPPIWEYVREKRKLLPIS